MFVCLFLSVSLYFLLMLPLIVTRCLYWGVQRWLLQYCWEQRGLVLFGLVAPYRLDITRTCLSLKYSTSRLSYFIQNYHPTWTPKHSCIAFTVCSHLPGLRQRSCPRGNARISTRPSSKLFQPRPRIGQVGEVCANRV